ncbi:RloB domain-containing protein [Dactylosporangium aurantiacum]|uniref:RloB domain-containing protein n=1 Tax=Dactylosporangium aurantiacum TaxID=35754 RepID=A0A9Q9IEF1_9ACTN|nr:RloB family protein [Dactylosporangium aurantiacum]MDG6108149.1 RloB family protein [Dactylosporangium aurantiacum]UWZ53856.1 RloB domain-containing protein [Dactylosporangium aurantiacum]
MARRGNAEHRGVKLGTGRETDLRRLPNRREQRTTVLVDTNGKSTEIKYFKCVKDLPWVTAGRVIVTFTNGSPLEVVRDAARRRDENEYDHAWAVCDVDDFDTVEPSTEAESLEVSLAWSNPCFEVWLILHRENSRAHIAGPKKAAEKLSRSIGKPWDKSTLNFADFDAGIGEAVRRAKQLDAAPAGNPSTNVWQLIELLGTTP